MERLCARHRPRGHSRGWAKLCAVRIHFPVPDSQSALTTTVHRPNDALMQSQFETTEGDAFLTFVLSFLPPPTTFPPPVANPQPIQGMLATFFVKH